MEMLEEFIKELLSHFDFAYMFAVNVLTYLLIKGIDSVNGDKAVSTAVKRLIAVLILLLLPTFIDMIGNIIGITDILCGIK